MTDNIENLDSNLSTILVPFTRDLEIIDCAYILRGAKNWQYAVEEHIRSKFNRLFYNPKTNVLEEGLINPSNTLLIIDDSFWGGGTFRGTVNFFKERGYNLDLMWGLHVLGEGLQAGPEKFGIPIFASARDYIEKILPKNGRKSYEEIYRAI
jgi:hypothetical protein